MLQKSMSNSLLVSVCESKRADGKEGERRHVSPITTSVRMAGEHEEERRKS